MKKIKIIRIILGVIGPCLIGSLLFSTIVYSNELINDLSIVTLMEFNEMLRFSLIFSIPFMGIQSILYTLLMEFIVSKKFDNKVVFIGVSTLLGSAAGLTLCLLGSARLWVFTMIGFTTGLILGYILYLLHDKNEQTPINANTSN